MCPVLFRSFIFSRTRSRWAPLGRPTSRVCCLMREKPLCVFQSGDRWEMSIPQLSSAVVWSVFYPGCLTIKLQLLERWVRVAHVGSAKVAQLSRPPTSVPREDAGVLVLLYLSNGRLTDSLLLRWRQQFHTHGAGMQWCLCNFNYWFHLQINNVEKIRL